MAGNSLEVLNARIEILSQQALSLLQTTKLQITSVECREIAMALEAAGFAEDAEYVWNRARESSRKESDIHELYASRGFAYFLFRHERGEEARQVLQEALERHSHDNDSSRWVHAETLRTWITWELDTRGPTAPIITELSRQINELVDACTTAR
jgi:hypothetical protein